MKKIVLIMSMLLSFVACNADDVDLKQWLADGVIIDVRSVQEYNTGHVSDATLIPHTEIVNRISMAVPDKATPVLLYCRSGNRAGIAEKELEKLGYEKVMNVGSLQDMETLIKTYSE